MAWWAAALRALAIFAYFVIFTVWVPSWLLKLDAIASADPAISDAISFSSWAVALAAGVVGLRMAQRKGWI